MTWPNILPNSAAFDADADSVAASRPELKKMSDAVNTMASNVYTAGSTTGTITPDVANGEIQRITLTGNITMNAFANPVAGQRLTMIFKQPAAGSTFDLTSNMLWENGAESLTQINGAVDTADILFDGTNYFAEMRFAHGSVEVYRADFDIVGDDSSGSTFQLGNTLQFTGSNGATVSVVNDVVTISGATGLTNPLNADFDVNNFAIVNNVANGHITLTPNGTGDVRLNTDTVRVGDSNADVTITTNGTADLILNTNNGSNSSSITIEQGTGIADADIILATAYSGTYNSIRLQSDVTRFGAPLNIQSSSGEPTLLINQGNGDLIIGNQNDPNQFVFSKQYIRFQYPTNLDAQNIDIVASSTTFGQINLKAQTVLIGNNGSINQLASNITTQLLLNSQRGPMLLTAPDSGNSNLHQLHFAHGNSSATQVRLTTPTSHTTAKMVLSVQEAAPNGDGSITIDPATNGDISINTKGTGAIVCFDKVLRQVEFKDYAETVYNQGNVTGSFSITVSNGNTQRMRLTGNITFTGFTDAREGQTVTLLITQDGTGNRTFTEGLDSAGRMLFAGGVSTLSTAANSTDIMTISFIAGTYFASINKGYV
jgi:hypothetical protein